MVIPSRNCIDGRKVELTAPEGYLSSDVTERTRCGSNASPWLIRLLPGQRVNITLIDFDYAKSARDASLVRDVTCRVYVTISDPEARHRSSSICGGRSRRLAAYLSDNNTAEVRIQGSQTAHAWNYFLLHYKGNRGALSFPAHREILLWM